MTSLRARAVTGGILWAFVIITLGLAGMSQYVASQTQSRFFQLLENRHTQAVLALVNNANDPSNLFFAIDDDTYIPVFSGYYWQIESAGGQLFLSPSLAGTALPRANPDLIVGLTDPGQTGAATPRSERAERIDFADEISITQIDGPSDQRLLVAQQWVTLEDGSLWHVQVASSLSNLDEDVALFRSTLLTAIGVISFVGVLGALAQVAVVLRPLNKLRQDVSSRWENEDGLEVKDYPIEVHPFVQDINSLLDRNRDIMRRSRRQAADLAHAIKTPSAIMRNELETLQQAGADVAEAVLALDRLDAQLKRSFARMRADGIEGAVGVYTDLDAALGRMDRAFQALARNQGKIFTVCYDKGLRVRMDQSDFEEVIGNILDNGLKFAKNEVTMSAQCLADDRVLITLSDDGPGIPAADIERAQQSGQRLDTSKPGTGLGLAIASDLVAAYGGKMDLGSDPELGGLLVQIDLPNARAKRSAI